MKNEKSIWDFNLEAGAAVAKKHASKYVKVAELKHLVNRRLVDKGRNMSYPSNNLQGLECPIIFGCIPPPGGKDEKMARRSGDHSP